MILPGHRRVCRGFTMIFNMGAGATLTLPLVNTRTEGSLSYNCYVNWGDGSSSHVTAYNDANAAHTYVSAGKYVVEILAGRARGGASTTLETWQAYSKS